MARAAWISALVAVALSVVGGAATCWVVRPRVEAEIERQLERRLGMSVEVGAVEFAWGAVTLRALELGGREADPAGWLDAVEVDLDRRALESGRAEVAGVAVVGGRVVGSRAGCLEIAQRLFGPRPAGSASGAQENPEGWVRLRPRRLRVDEVAVELADPAPEGERRFSATVSVAGDLQRMRVQARASGVRVERGGRLVAAGRSVSATVAGARAADGPTIEFPLRVELAGVSAPLAESIALVEAGGWIEIADATASEIRLDVSGRAGDGLGADAGKLWWLAGRVRRDLSEGALRLDVEDFELARVWPEILAGLPLAEAENASVGGHAAVVVKDGIAAVQGDLSLRGFGLRAGSLAPRPVRDVGVDLSFAAEVDPRARRVVVHDLEVEREGVALLASAVLEHAERRRGRRYSVGVEVPTVACQAVLRAIPPGFAPALEGFQLRGEFSAHVSAHVDFADLESLSLDGRVDMDGCEVVSTPPRVAVERLAGGFTHRVLMRNGGSAVVPMFNGAPGFASIEEVSPFVTAAIRTTEDGGFWTHKGFSPSQLEVALRRNLAAGQVRLGASTITMQMVKNVLLGHERTLSRKFQEMFLTWYVERVLTKTRIMEIYLNAIEYGPGIYGIVDASSYYFGKHPLDLNPPEAVFLALMLPSPVKRSVHYCNGVLSPRFAAKVERVLAVMNRRGRLADLEYEAWKGAGVAFDLRRRGSESACHARIAELASGAYTQRPLSGLLPSVRRR